MYYQEPSSPILDARLLPSSPKKKLGRKKTEHKSDPVLSHLNITIVKATQIGTAAKPTTRESQTSENGIKVRLLINHQI